MILALLSCFSPSDPFEIRTSWVSQSEEELVLDIELQIRKPVCVHDQQLVPTNGVREPDSPPYNGQISDLPYTSVSNIDSSFRLRLGLFVDPDVNYVHPPTYSLGVRCVAPGDVVHRRVRIPLPLRYRPGVVGYDALLPCNPQPLLRVEVSYSYGEQPRTDAYITPEGERFEVWRFDGGTLQQYLISDPIDLPVPPNPVLLPCRITPEHIPSHRYWDDPELSNARFENWEKNRSPNTPPSAIIERRWWIPPSERKKFDPSSFRVP